MLKEPKKKSKRFFTGFTLLELLVVIAIIALISLFAYAAVNQSRMKARDAKRMSDIKEIEKALQLYYEDYGYYPGAQDAPLVSIDWWDQNYGWWYLSRALAPYLKNFPKDPINRQVNDPSYDQLYDHPGDYFYYYYSPQKKGAFTGSDIYGQYDLWARLEDKKNNYRCEFVNYTDYNNQSPCDADNEPEMKDLFSAH